MVLECPLHTTKKKTMFRQLPVMNTTSKSSGVRTSYSNGNYHLFVCIVHAYEKKEDVPYNTCRKNFIQLGTRYLWSLLNLMKSSNNPISANASVANAAPLTGMELFPAMPLATAMPIGTKNMPPIVGTLFLRERLIGPCFLSIFCILMLSAIGTNKHPAHADIAVDSEKGCVR